jgi:hypothetical protein
LNLNRRGQFGNVQNDETLADEQRGPVMTLTRFLPLCIHLLIVMPALAGDPHAPQLNASFLAQPAAITQNGSMRLAYEMLITNFSKSSYVLDAIEARAGEAQAKFAGARLEAMTTHLGAPAQQGGPSGRTIAAGRSVIVFLVEPRAQLSICCTSSMTKATGTTSRSRLCLSQTKALSLSHHHYAANGSPATP